MLRRSSLLLLALTLVAAACGGDDGGGSDGSASGRPASGGKAIGPAGEGIDGVVAFQVDSNAHTEDDLAYEPSPPAGGDHFPVPATCGFYQADPPPEEMLVHALEHGSVWIAYDPDLDGAQIEALKSLVASQPKVIATPHDGLPSPLVVTAWARQMEIDGLDDPRLPQFVQTYRSAATAPEPAAACQGAGDPEVVAPTA